MALIGPALCHNAGARGSVLFAAFQSPPPAAVAVGIFAAAGMFYALSTGTPPAARMAAVVVPAVGLTVGHAYLDRVIIVPLCAVAVAAVDRPSSAVSAAAIPLVAAVVAAVAAGAGAACDGAVPVAADAVALVAAGVSMARARPRPSVAAALALAECTAIVVVIASDPAVFPSRESHLTWWGVAALAAFDWERARGGDNPARPDAIWLTVVLVQSVIVVGVWTMSVAECGLLQAAYDDVGPNVYFWGNLLLHYYPLFRLIAYTPTKIVNPGTQLIRAAAVVVVYTSTTDPAAVYGCGEWAHAPLPAVGFTLVVVAVAAAAVAGCDAWVYPTS